MEEIRCPCRKCQNRNFHTLDEVKYIYLEKDLFHIIMFGIGMENMHMLPPQVLNVIFMKRWLWNLVIHTDN